VTKKRHARAAAILSGYSWKGSRMEKIKMSDILPLLPIDRPPKGKSAYYIPCPHCDRRGRKQDKHLNINLIKDVFRCPMCGWNGGIFDLYAFYIGIPRDKVRTELIRKLRNGSSDINCEPPVENMKTSVPEITEVPVAGIEARNAAYSALLSLIELAPDHRTNLIQRGFSERAIMENGYRTTPMVGGKVIAKKIMESICSVEGVPGFSRGINSEWTFITNRRGILIPVRDIQGRIQGLQVRRDNIEKRKYRWVSSAGNDGGCGALSWLHLAGPVREHIILIEGPMKADLVYHLSGQSALAVPGVNALKYLEQALTDLIELGVNHVMTAFDMDLLKNPHVQNGYTELVSLLGRSNLRFGTYLWHPGYNGLDDYIWEFCLGKET